MTGIFLENHPGNLEKCTPKVYGFHLEDFSY